ncbi:MAG: DUF1684 domain-containing protein [Bacteroidetes bacterium]|nr:DUF1684 domain-containing protein [Bacteroidota bacterium]
MKRNLSLGAIILVAVLILLMSLYDKHTPEEIEYIKKIENYRTEKDSSFKSSPSSPFNYKGKVEFHSLKYFDVDPEFAFKSKLFEYEPKDTITYFGTKGEERTAVRYGYVQFKYHETLYKVNVYQGSSRNGEIYHMIWYTDKTTNKESYGVGRYLDFEVENDPHYLYTIDFNLAYNPYCAYSKEYSCAIPTKEDYIDLEITAGEQKFHD